MTTRTFKQKGQAYGSSTASIEASIDGVVIYSGPVNTLDEPIPTLPAPGINYGVDIFTWTNDVAFSGTQTLSLSVTGADLVLTDSVANYIMIVNPDYNPADPTSPQWISGGADVYGSFYNTTVGDAVYSDPFTDEEIDGVEQVPSDPSLTGQWYWKIPAGSTFTTTINIQPGSE